MNAVYKQDSLG